MNGDVSWGAGAGREVKEQEMTSGTSLSLALASLSSHEASFILHRWRSSDPMKLFALDKNELLQSGMIARVLDKGLMRTVAVMHGPAQSVYEWTPFGRATAERLLANDGVLFELSRQQ
jgi:hypothetical protein